MLIRWIICVLCVGLLASTGCSKAKNDTADSVKAEETAEVIPEPPKRHRKRGYDDSREEERKTQVVEDANDVMFDAMEQAKEDDKNILVLVGASWSEESKRLEEFLYSYQELFSMDYILVTIDRAEMINASDLFESLKRGREAEVPLMVILDSSGHELASSISPSGNIGYPSESHEISHFMKIIKQTCADPAKEHLRAIAGALKDHAELVDSGVIPESQIQDQADPEDQVVEKISEDEWLANQKRLIQRQKTEN